MRRLGVTVLNPIIKERDLLFYLLEHLGAVDHVKSVGQIYFKHDTVGIVTVLLRQLSHSVNDSLTTSFGRDSDLK